MFVVPKISEQEARNIFSKKKRFSFFRLKKKSLPVERVELVSLPFYLFDVNVKEEGKGRYKKKPLMQNVVLSVDGLLGHTVFYVKDDLDFGSRTKSAVCSFELTPAEAEKFVLSEYRAFLLEHGLRTRSAPRAEKISEGRRIFYPFWIGYFRKRGRYDFIVLDAVSGEIQGIKMRKVFMKAFRLMT
jgi:hypothetical protein